MAEASCRVVVVDDSAANLAIMKGLIRAIGADAAVFLEPARALAEIDALAPDLIVVDYRMPVMDGIQFVQAAKVMAGGRDIPIVMVTASDETTVRHAALEAGAADFISRPIDAVEVKSRLRNLLQLGALQKRLKARADDLAAEVEKATQVVAAREEEIILRLARAAEFRDEDTGQHIMRMARYSEIIAEGLGLDAETCRLIRLATPMHDVGKIGISDTVLLKPGKLTPEERYVIQQHTAFGEQILEGSSSHLIVMARLIAGAHHEQWDGTGYPRGLAGEDIPLVGRIAAVADVFDALTTERPYKAAWSAEAARTFVIDGTGSQFDPACVEAFLRKWDDILKVRSWPAADGGPDAMQRGGFSRPGLEIKVA